MGEKRTYINNPNDLIINLKDMFIKLLKKWYIIAGAALLGALLLGAYGAVSGGSGDEGKLTEKELSDVNNAKLYRQQIDSYIEYQKNSLLMEIDYSNKATTVLKYYIDTAHPDEFDDYSLKVVEAYNAYVNSDAFREAVASAVKLDTAPQYIAEVITSEISVSTTKMNELVDIYATRVLTITIIGKDKEITASMAKAAEGLINSYIPEIEDKIGKHNMELISESTNTSVDTALMNRQNAVYTSITTLTNQRELLVSGFSRIQKKLYDEESGNGMAKYIIIGIILGVFVSAVALACVYIFSGKLHSVEDVKNRYALSVFGNQCIGPGLQQAEGEVRRKLVAAAIIKTCLKENISDLFMTSSCLLSEREAEYVKAIASELKGSNINAVYGEGLDRNVQIFEQMSDIGNVIIIEKIEASKRQAIDAELELCSEQRARVLGIMLLCC